MKNIVYLLGAGASAKTLPMVKQIPKSIDSVIKKLIPFLDDKSFIEHYTFKYQNQNPQEILSLFIDRLNDLKEKCEEHASIDSYAKKLHVIHGNHNTEIEKLKNTFSAYFTIEQIIKGLDDRYDTFFTSILQKDFSLPENVNILSWNYDFQLEKALSAYTNRKDIFSNQEILQVASKNENYKTAKNYKTFKLNGTSSIKFGDNNSHYYYELSNNLDVKSLSEILIRYNMVRNGYYNSDLGNKYYSNLSFAWEDDVSDKNNIINLAKTKTNNCNILVVIGYSFPFFNKEIDRKLFNINSMPNLEKVYFQSPCPKEIEQSFELLRPKDEKINFSRIEKTEQFFLPIEL